MAKAGTANSVDNVNVVSTSPQVGLGLPRLAVSEPLTVQELTLVFVFRFFSAVSRWSLTVSGRIWES